MTSRPWWKSDGSRYANLWVDVGRCVAAAVAVVLVVSSGQLHAQTPQRVASLVPAATEVLFAIGAGERVVGVGDYDDYPAAVEKLPRLGGLVDPNLEAILAVRPNFVVIDPAQRSLAAQLEGLDIKVYAFATGSIQEMLDHVHALGRELDLEANAARVVVTVEAGLAAVTTSVAGQPRTRVLVVFGRRAGSFAELWVSGGVGFLHDVVELAGGSNVFEDIARPGFKSGLEGVLSRAPDVVIEFVEVNDRATAISAEWRALPGFAAVRVVTIEAGWTLRPSPRVVMLAARVADALHPQRSR